MTLFEDLPVGFAKMPDGHFEALNKALKLFGVEIGREEHDNYFNGLPSRKKLEELERQDRLPPGLRDFINDVKQKYTKELIPQYCVPDYAKIIMLNHLKAKNMLLGCCSNSVQETLHLMLRSAHIYDHFDLILGNDQVKKPKPHPEIYLQAFKILRVKPSEAIIVEDAPHGIAAAKASGAKVIEVRGVEDVNLSLFENLIFK